MEIYEKRNATNTHVLGRYKNKTIKLVWYEYGKKCCLASTLPTQQGNKNLYKVKLAYDEMTYDEMLGIHECLLKARTGGVNNFFISEKNDWKGDRTRLMLKDSEYSGLVIIRMLAKKPLDVVEGDVPSEEDDADLEPVPNTTPDMQLDYENVEWVELWDKFFISKNDDWLYMASVINKFCQSVDHTMNVDDESVIPPTPPPQSQNVNDKPTTSSPFNVMEVQKLVSDAASTGGKTKGKSGSVGGVNKRKRVITDVEDEVRRATCLVLTYMGRYGVDFNTVITKYRSELKEIVPFDYELLRDFDNMMNETNKKLRRLTEISGIENFAEICTKFL